MRMKNVQSAPVRVKSELLDNWGTGKRPEYVTISPGQVVSVHDGYAHRRRGLAGVMPSVAEQQSLGALKPDGPAAIESYRRFHDELPAVVAAMVASRDNTNATDSELTELHKLAAIGKRLLQVEQTIAEREATPAALQPLDEEAPPSA